MKKTDQPWFHTSLRRRILLLGLMLLVPLTVGLAVGLGPVDVTGGQVVRILLAPLAGLAQGGHGEVGDPVIRTIILDIRLPRTILALLVGASLALAGAVSQGFFQNPMADPYIIGISAGAALGATIALMFRLDMSWLGFNAVSVLAFGGALAVTFLVYLLSLRGGRTPPGILLLTGIAVGSVATALTAFFQIMGRQDLRAVLLWIMGSVANRHWLHVQMILPYFLVALAVLYAFARDLNLLLLGEETAATLGIQVEQTKLVLLVTSALLAATAVAVSGIIGFVGLIVPHLMRMAIGPDHRILLPTSALGGAILLVLADTLARLVIAPTEMPVGIITAILGGPFFLYLIWKQRERVF